jgi:pimeloyl-ACP methyl ester carboxylesterase
VPDADQLGRRIGNPDVAAHGMDQLRALDIVDQLGRVDSPTLVCVGALDPITPVAASREIVGGLPRGLGRLAIIKGAGHFPWKDAPERYWPLLERFIAS